MSEKTIYECRHEVQTGPGQTVCEADPCMCRITIGYWIDPPFIYDYAQEFVQSWDPGVADDPDGPDDIDAIDALAIGLADLFGGE